MYKLFRNSTIKTIGFYCFINDMINITMILFTVCIQFIFIYSIYLFSYKQKLKTFKIYLNI